MARRRKMDPERKAFINSLLEHYQPKDAQDIQEMLKDLLGETLQGMLEAEMDDHLGYSKYDYKNKETDDSRNGYSPKTVTSSMGTIDLDIPRDRKGEFEPQIVKKNQTDISNIEDQVLSMYAKGMTTRDGYKKSCGCLSHPPIKDYVGKRFGMLTVLEYAGKWDKIHHWKCLCDCGKETIVAQTPLQNGHTKSCGCNGNPPMEDLTGRIFGRLTVIEEAEWKKGTSYWRCKCECGNETVVKYGYLISGHTKSCGCLQKTQIIENLKLVEGMSITKLETRKNKLSSANTSGYTGVFQNKKTGKWVAQITFKGKCYHLGVFEKIEDAVKARQRGEEMYDDFLEWYYSEHPKQENKKET